MPLTLTPAQIELAHDMETIAAALASGYMLPPKAPKGSTPWPDNWRDGRTNSEISRLLGETPDPIAKAVTGRYENAAAVEELVYPSQPKPIE